MNGESQGNSVSAPGMLLWVKLQISLVQYKDTLELWEQETEIKT